MGDCGRVSLSVPYYIMNKNVVMGIIRWKMILGGSNSALLEEDLCLPDFIKNNLDSWLNSRVPPKHRRHMTALLRSLGLRSAKSVIDYSYGLALTDIFWVTWNLDIKWEDINFFTNKFDETIAQLAFSGELKGECFSSTSPEFSTGGMLPKCWIREGSSVYLIKGGTEGVANSGMEPYSEVMSSQILDVLGYNHVPYVLARYKGRLVSKCPLITDESKLMISLWMLCNAGDISYILDYCESKGILNKLFQIFIFDYLSCNIDRHANNISVLLDSIDYSVIDMAPIYDNGCAMLCYYEGDVPLDAYINSIEPSLYDMFEPEAMLAKTYMTEAHNVERLLGFHFDRRGLKGMDSERIALIEKFLQSRVETFLSW